MFKQENLTTEEHERQKAAHHRFREIVKQRWQEETLKNLSKKALQKISKNSNLPLPSSMNRAVIKFCKLF